MDGELPVGTLGASAGASALVMLRLDRVEEASGGAGAQRGGRGGRGGRGREVTAGFGAGNTEKSGRF